MLSVARKTEFVTVGSPVFMRLAIRFRDWDSTFEDDALSLVIGRPKAGNSPPDVDLSPDRTVSRPHARLFWQGGDWYLEDLGSTHGTQLNGREIREEGAQRLKAGDSFQCGETMLRPEAQAQPDSELAEIPPPLVAAIARTTPISVPSPPVAPNPRNESDSDSPDEDAEFLSATRNKPKARDANNPQREAPAVAIVSNSSVASDSSIEFCLSAVGESQFPPLEDGAARQLGNLYDILLRCGSTLDLDDLLRDLIARLVSVIPAAKRGALLLHSRETDALLLAGFYGSSRPAVSETLARRAMQQKEAFLWRGLAEEDGEAAGGSIARFAITSALIAPLIWRDEAMGVLCIDSPEGTVFSQSELSVLMFVAHHIALALANRRLSEDLRRETNVTANLLRQFSPQYRDQLLHPAGLQLSGERGEVTILVSDIRGFESLTRHMEPIAVVEMLNDYFSRLSPIIWEHNGSIDKYIGDAILAVFGSPKKDDKQHENALKAALEMQAEMTRSNAARARKGKVTCEIGIGVHCGVALHGFMGVLDQLSLTVIGDAVNRASRYCDGAQGGEIIMSPQVYQWVWKDVQATSTSLTTKHGESIAAFRLLCFGDSRD